MKSKQEFDQASSTLCGRMVSLDAETRAIAATRAGEILRTLPAFLANSPHCQGEISAMRQLVAAVDSEVPA